MLYNNVEYNKECFIFRDGNYSTAVDDSLASSSSFRHRSDQYGADVDDVDDVGAGMFGSWHFALSHRLHTRFSSSVFLTRKKIVQTVDKTCIIMCFSNVNCNNNPNK